MTKLLFGIMLLAGLAFLALNHWAHRLNGYTIQDGRVFFHQVNTQYKRVAILVESADAATFHRYAFPRHEYGRDARHVFYQGRILPACDPATFEITDVRRALSRDAQRTYRKAVKIEEPAAGYRHLGGGYHVDKQGAYWKEQIAGADPETFRYLGFSYEFGSGRGSAVYACDQFRVYCDGQVIEGAVPTDFELLGSNYATDGKRIYYRHQLVSGAEPASFQISDEHSFDDLARDAKRFYRNGQVVSQSTSQTSH